MPVIRRNSDGHPCEVPAKRPAGSGAPPTDTALHLTQRTSPARI